MGEDKRKCPRFECSIHSEVIKVDENSNLIERTAILDFSRDGLRLGVDFVNPLPGSNVDIEILLPAKQLIATLSGEAIWSRYEKNRMEIGLKLRDMDSQAKENILKWVYFRNLEKAKKEKKGQLNIQF